VPAKYRGTLLYREEIEGIQVLRCWLYTTPNRGVFKRSIAFLTFMFSSTLCGAFFAPRPDVVAATSPQMLCGLAGYVVALLKRRPFVLEVRDLWPKQIIDLGVVRNGLIIGLLTWLETFLYRRARAVVTVAEATRREIVDRGFAPEKVHTITNGILEDFFRPGERMTPLRAERGWREDQTVVMYIGTHGLSQGLVTLLDTAGQLRGRPDIRFVFVGVGAEREFLIHTARQRGLDNIEFLPMQSKEDMPGFYASADICLVPLKRRDVFLYNIPSKMFEIMACGRPMILGVLGQAKALLEEAGAGVAVEPENAAAYAEAIVRLADDPAERARLGAAGRAHVVAHYARGRKAEDYLRCFEAAVTASAASPPPRG
jgi:glycosyltransferase involved in cell wall biosynthesis